MEVNRHFIKEKLEAKIVQFPYMKSEDQLADILTKAVNAKSYREVLSKLSIGNPLLNLRGSVGKKIT